MKISKNSVLLFACGVLFSIVGFFLYKYNYQSDIPNNQQFQSYQVSVHRKNVCIGTSCIVADIADTQDERERGLSGRKELAENEGMLFVFDNANRWMFWMKDMAISIDILWISQDKRISDITRNVSPESYPKVFTPKSEAQFVIEVASGWADRHNIRIGDDVSW